MWVPAVPLGSHTCVCPEHIAGQKANKIPVKVSKNALGEHS